MQFNPASIKSTSQKLIARYVHSGNSTIVPTSVALSTGLFTTSQTLPYASGTVLSDILVSYPNGIPSKLFSEWNGSNTYGIKVNSPNTFYVLSGNTTVVTYGAGETAIDVTKMQFEYNMASPPTIDFTGVIVGDNIFTTWAGIKNRPGWTNVSINFNYSGGSNQWYLNALDGRCFQMGYYEQNFNYSREIGMLYGWGSKVTTQQWNGGTSWSLNSNIDGERTFTIYPNLTVTGVSIGGGISNGTVVEVYSVV